MDKSSVKTVSCSELFRARANGPVDLIDVRSLEEFNTIHAVGARHVPLDAFDPTAVVRARTTPASEPLYFICAVGARSAWACELMMAAGYPNVVNVDGGTQAWYLAGFPVQST